MVTIGTRGSKLALVQSEIVKNSLLRANPKLKIQIKIIKTEGDRNLKPIPLDVMGKGWFTKEVEKELLDGKIDIAVHSLKDLPNEIPKDLSISAVLKREDARDVLVTGNKVKLNKLKKGAVVGTDSLRRQIQILKIRPDLKIKSVRGNIPTRLQKLDSGQYDGLIIAAAGLIRLGLKHRISQYFSHTEIVPAPGQGALAVQTRILDTKLNNFLKKISDEKTEIETRQERLFSSKTGGNCKLPVAAYAKISRAKLTVCSFISNIDGSGYASGSIIGNVNSQESLGKKLALKLLKKSKKEWLSNVHILLTRSEEDNKKLGKKLEKYGAKVQSIPTIRFSLNTLKENEKKILKSINHYNYCIFTSKKGVEFLWGYYRKNKISIGILNKCKLIAVGSQTANSLKRHRLKISFIPNEFSNKKIIEGIKKIAGRKVVLIRSDISDKDFKKDLIKKEGEVYDIPLYKTTNIEGFIDRKLQEMETHGKINYIFFMSPSSVKGFIKRILDKKLKQDILTKNVISIGYTTTKEVLLNGFKKVHTSEVSTIDGMINILKKITHAKHSI